MTDVTADGHWRGRKCLVTGGSGFAGSHLVARLADLGADITILDLRPPAAGGDARYVCADICDAGAVGAAMDVHRPQAVFHLAAQPIVPRSITEPGPTLSVNATGTFTVLEAVRTRVGVEAFVFASSGAYYGEHFDEHPLVEADPPRAGPNLYGASKIAADIAVQAYVRTYGMSASVCRFMNIYGPRDPNRSRLIPAAIERLQTGQPYDFGDRDDGTTRLDFLYVSDVVAGYLRAAERLIAGDPGGCYNFGTAASASVREITQMVSVAFDGVERDPVFRGTLRDRPLVKRLDATLAEKELGWRAQVPLAEGITRTVRHAMGLG